MTEGQGATVSIEGALALRMRQGQRKDALFSGLTSAFSPALAGVCSFSDMVLAFAVEI